MMLFATWRILISMSLRHIRIQWKLLSCNYLGGLGYYALYCGWAVACYSILNQALRYIVLSSEPVINTPPSTTSAVVHPETLSSVMSVVLFVCTSILYVTLLICVVSIPYLIGYASRQLPRWCLSHTSWPITRLHVLRVKLAAASVLLVSSVVILYTPEAPAQYNLGFFFASSATIVSAVCVWLQYIAATLWHIPERRMF